LRRFITVVGHLKERRPPADWRAPSSTLQIDRTRLCGLRFRQTKATNTTRQDSGPFDRDLLLALLCLEGATAAFGEVIVFLLLLLFVSLLALDGQRAVGVIALVHPWQLRRDLVCLFRIDDVDGWRLAPADLAAPERLNIE